MIIINPLILASLSLTIGGGIFLTRKMHLHKQKNLLASRLSAWSPAAATGETPISLLKLKNYESGWGAAPLATLTARLDLLIAQSGVQTSTDTVLIVCATLFLLPPAVATIFGFEILYALIPGSLLCWLPLLFLVVKRSALRQKFVEQLPDAMDLMISVLRSGHSINQAVKTVSQEVPVPCGAEFGLVMQRMNLGLPLAEALNYSCQKFVSHELDLIRRAFAIQSEVGGSLAELLDKTNSTLRGRLKLIKHVTVLTAQSRLTMIIVGALPIVMAIALNYMNPNYLTPLVQSELGKTLIGVAICLEILGLYIMKRLSTVKI